MASAILAGFAAVFVIVSAYNWRTAHRNPSGDQQGHMDTALALAFLAILLIAIGWVVAWLQ